MYNFSLLVFPSRVKKVTLHKVLSKSKQQYDKRITKIDSIINYFANNKFLVNPGSFQSLKDGGGGGERFTSQQHPSKDWNDTMNLLFAKLSINYAR